MSVCLPDIWLKVLHLFVGDVFWIALVLASADLLVNAGPGQTEAIVDSAVHVLCIYSPRNMDFRFMERPSARRVQMDLLYDSEPGVIFPIMS